MGECQQYKADNGAEQDGLCPIFDSIHLKIDEEYRFHYAVYGEDSI